MPRDINGNYTLPAGNPVVSGTLIESVWCNTTMDDIAAALSDSLSRSGSGGMLGPMRFADGSAAAPGIGFTNEPTSGWYRAGLNDFRFSIAGADWLKISPGTTTFYTTNLHQRTDGVFDRWVNPSAPTGKRTMGLQIEVTGESLFGMMTNDFSAFLPMYMRFDANTDFIKMYSANGFSVSNALLGADFFTVDNVLEYLAIQPSVNDSSAALLIEDGDFYITKNGAVQSNYQIGVGQAAWSTGGVFLFVGTAALNGRIGWTTPGGTEFVSLGGNSIGNNFTWTFAGAVHPGLSIQGAYLTVAPTVSDTSAYNSSALSLNIYSARTGLAVHNVNGSGAGVAATFMWTNNVVGSISYSNVATTYNTVSDRRLKEDVRKLTSVGDIIDDLEPVRFKWRGTKADAVGFIAQDVVDVVPEAVTVPENPDAVWQMDAGKLMPYVIAELKHLRNRVDQLEG